MASKCILIGSDGLKLKAEDVARVARYHSFVARSPLAVKSSPLKIQQGVKVEDAPGTLEDAGLESAALMPAPAVRATLVVKLAELAAAEEPPRAEVLNFLVSLLNQNVLPALPDAQTDAAVLERLVGIFYGSGPSCSGGTFAMALKEAQIVAPGLSLIEKKAVTSGRAPSVARQCLSLLDTGAGKEAAPLPAPEALLEAKEAVASVAGRRKPKLAKGTRDFLPEQMAIREKAFGAIVGVFKRHGAVALDTPVFELRETLMGKYGEDSKLIYDLADQGGEILSLRYDLTVPFARFLAMHNVGNIKRYHIARVYRRDQPQASRGRFREFYQCDFDVAGAFPPMMADAEVVKVMTEIYSELNIGSFCIRLSDRRLLDAIFEVAGVPASKFRAVCSSVDKLDKLPWAEVRREIIEDKGLSPEAADAVGRFAQLKSPIGSPGELLALLRDPARSPFGGNARAKAALEEVELLLGYLKAMGAAHFVQFDMSLARGLDYYTGAIFEAVLTGEGTNVGSIGGGGRYDNLVGMFSGKEVPCVGASVGIERVFDLLAERERAANSKIRATQTEVMVASIGAGLAAARMKVASELWTAGLKAEYLFAEAPSMQKQLAYAIESGIPLVVVFGGDELGRNQLKLKNLAMHDEITIARGDLVPEAKRMLGGPAHRAALPIVVS